MRDTKALDEWEERQNSDNVLVAEILEGQYDIDPISVEDALSRPDRDKWIEAMAEEFELLKENSTWELVPRPKDREVIDTKWVFHLKHNVDGSIEKRKGRFVARGFTQVEGIDYNETYSPVVSYSSLRTLIALAIEYDLILHQMDVKNIYLNGELDVELYIEQPLFFEEKDREKNICRLKKGLYGLKQAGRIWNEILYNFLISKGYKALDSEPSIYIRRIGKNIMIITIYIKDLPILANNPVVLEKVK